MKRTSINHQAVATIWQSKQVFEFLWALRRKKTPQEIRFMRQFMIVAGAA